MCHGGSTRGPRGPPPEEHHIGNLTRTFAVGALAAGLALGGVACGNDEDDDGATTDEEVGELDETVDESGDQLEEEVEQGTEEVEE